MTEPLHSWEVTVEEAIRIQEDLKHRILIKNTLSKVKTVAGADVSYSKDHRSLSGGIAVLSFPDLKILDKALAFEEVRFPYIPGLFSFREAPVLLQAFQRLKIKPDLILFDGQGIAHPRRFGMASHLGLWLDLPSIGCAKTSLIKDYVLPKSAKGSLTWIYLKGEKVGAVLRTRANVKPIFISPGHRVDLATSIRIVLTTCQKYRIPEPIRIAHHLAQSLSG